MKKLTLLLALTTTALAFVCAVQWTKLQTQKAQLTGLQTDTQEKSEQIAELEAARSRAETQRSEWTERANQLATQLAAAHSTQTAPTAKAAASPPEAPAAAAPKAKDAGNPLGSMLSKMMQDPDTRKLIQDQQRVLLDQLYAPLVKQWGMSPDEANKFKDMLADHMMESSQQASAMLAGTNRTELSASLAANQKAFDEQLKNILGEDRFTQYKDYQETSGERMQLNLFNQQNAGSNLSEPQVEQLLAIMKEEKQKANAAPSGFGASPPKEQQDFQAMLSDEQSQKMLQSQEAVSQRVYERARTLLSEDQLAAFGKFQTNQLQMMRVGIGMARKMFAPNNASGSDGATQQ